MYRRQARIGVLTPVMSQEEFVESARRRLRGFPVGAERRVEGKRCSRTALTRSTGQPGKQFEGLRVEKQESHPGRYAVFGLFTTRNMYSSLTRA